MNTPPRRKGFTLIEVMVVSGLMALLAVLLSSAAAGVGKPAVDLIGRGQLVQEMNMAVAALAHDLGGSLANPAGRLGAKKQSQWVGWMQPANEQLWLCFDGGTDPDGLPAWGPPDTVVVYELSEGVLLRSDSTAGTTFTVARNVDSFQVTPMGGDAVQVFLSFTYRQYTRSCTVIAQTP